MAKALEVFFPDFSPSPLQQAAIKRIQEYKEELKQYGMVVRSAMELEFMIQDQNGSLIPGVINLGKAYEHLKKSEGLPYIESVVLEGELPLRHKMADLATQFEVNVGDDAIKKPLQLSPESVAAVVEHLKTRSLKRMLLETSVLTPSAQMHDGVTYSPNFEARPHADAPKNSLDYNEESSSLHVNVSLCDLKGNNLFAKSADLLKHCAATMAISMAALVDTVRNKVHKTEKPETRSVSIKVDRFTQEDYPKYDLPKTRSGLVDNFTELEHAKHLQELLGKEFYDLILNEYQTGKTAAMAR